MMKLDSLEEVKILHAHRQKALDLQEAITGSIECTIAYKGDKIDPFKVISADPVRKAILLACQEFIAEKEQELQLLGVDVSAETDQ